MTAKQTTILCLNSGSSSVKFALYELAGEEEKLVAGGAVERIGRDGGYLWIQSAKEETLKSAYGDYPEHKVAVKAAFDSFEQLDLPGPAAVGHRIVHGGLDYRAPAKVNSRLLDSLHELISFAPLHLPSEIQGIQAVAERLPGLPQVACFDTAFHRRMPELAQRFPLPRHLWDEGLRRYGFHGLSYEFILDTLGAATTDRVIIAHLGNGASMVAVRSGRPLDTTMGFTPAGGFMMGTRSGDLDPGVLLYLLKNKRYDIARVDELVNHQSGLMGVSGISSDVKTLLEKRKSDPQADQALEMFCYQLRKHIGALTTVLGGIDTLVFTGGIGERAAPVRRSVCHGLEHLGLYLDEEQNKGHAEIISTPDSPCTIRVMLTNEDLVIARHTYRLLLSNK